MATLKLNEKNQNYFCNLPYSNYNIIQIHGQFNNLMPDINLPSKRYLERLPSCYDIDLFIFISRSKFQHELGIFFI